MTDALRARLQTSLGTAYTLERELGGGGMSRVFVAREEALGRSVVLKVLPPDVAAELSADRFAQEVQVAARLQDPHIVPVLSAGDAGGLPYYTMPYVAGESLRERLRREPRPPLAESVEVLRGMLLALAAAHEAGVVHRDVKPENVLLTRAGTPVVTDFGIAKAVAASRTLAEGLPADGALTRVGTSLGTPAYMAPEQAAGAGVDHRADLYAWGVAAYELLAGAHPFAGKTNPQQLVAAHLMERPAPLAPRAADAPADLVRLVERALSKAPEERPSGAREMLRLLDAATGRSTSGAGTPNGPAVGRGAMVGIAVAVLVAAAAAVATLRGRSAAAAPSLSPARVVVLPFDNRTGDPALGSLGTMAADWITRGISETGLVDVAAVAATNVREDARLAVARTAGAGTLLTGAVYRAGDSVRIVATIADVRDGRVAVSLDPVSAPSVDPVAGLETLRRRVAGALARRVDPAFDVDRLLGAPPSFEVYRALLDARAAARDEGARDRYANAAALYRRAEALDTGYALVMLEEAGMLSNQRDFPRMDTVFAWLERRRARLTPYEAARLDLMIASRGHLDPAARLAAARRLAALAPRSAAAQGTLGTALLVANRAAEADSILSRVDTTRVYGPGLFLIHSHVARLLGDHVRELTFVDAARRRAPNDANVLGWRIRALTSLGRVADARAAVDSVALGPRASREEEVFGAAVVGLLAAGRGAEARDVAELFARRAGAVPGVPFDVDPPRVFPVIAALEFAGRHADALRTVDSVIATLPRTPRFELRPGMENDYPVWLVALRGAMLARGGDSARAAAADRQLQALRPTGIALASALVGRAAIAAQLGRRDAAVARLREAIDAAATFSFTSAGSLMYINSGIAPDSPWLAPLRGYAPFEDLVRPVR